jgi:hypothetical protein
LGTAATGHCDVPVVDGHTPPTVKKLTSMTNSAPSDDRCDLPLLPDADHNLTDEEVQLLWSFIHGDIMNEPTRVRLRKSWGLCARHAWGSAVTEIELWQSGAGVRGGHQPFDAAVLYDDLTGHMYHALEGSRRWSRRRALRGKGACIVCDDVRAPALAGTALTHGGFTASILAGEANALHHTRGWLAETRPEWAAHVCPNCASGAALDTSATAVRCRPHLIEAEAFDSETTATITRELAHMHGQVRALGVSMTERGAPSTPEVDASWVRALGWFHGWEFPLAVVRAESLTPRP